MRRRGALGVLSFVRTRLLAVIVFTGSTLLLACNESISAFAESPEEPPFFRPDGSTPPDPFFLLGQALFFDPELSGNRNIACATCHVPFLGTSEGIPIAIGEGAVGLGPLRSVADGAILTRNTQALFAHADRTTFFWDGRVQVDDDASLEGPVTPPEGLNGPLELASLLPLLDRAEMRGQVGDNELADIPDEDPARIWEAIVARLNALDGYRTLVRNLGRSPSFLPPGVHEVDELDVATIGNALASFQNTLWADFTTRHHLGELTERAMRGEDLFRGEVGCVDCHAGQTFSDDLFHNLAVPQIVPESGELDVGRERVTGDPSDRFAFRTPPLINVAMTPPYMHDGAYSTLEAAVRHHLDPVASLAAYDPSVHLPAGLRSMVRNDADTQAALTENVSADTMPARRLTDEEIGDIVEFLGQLTTAQELRRAIDDGVPESVPSGLPVPRWTGPHPFRD